MYSSLKRNVPYAHMLKSRIFTNDTGRVSAAETQSTANETVWMLRQGRFLTLLSIQTIAAGEDQLAASYL